MFIIIVFNDFVWDWLEFRYFNLIVEMFYDFMGEELDVKFIILFN